MSRKLSLVVKSLVVIALAILVCQTVLVHAQENLQAWENFDFARQAVKPAQIVDVSLDELKFLRGVIFGRHGRIFKDAEIKEYLEKQSWYEPSAEFKNDVLNDTERRNLDLIREAEATKHDQVEPGDMRIYRNRALTTKRLGVHTGAEWTVLAAEVGAIHGQRFDGTPWLQAYFEDRYWYKPSDHYDPKQLTEIERKNLQLIVNANKKQRHVAISPGDMEFFENKLISEQLLHGLSLNELRLLRNEIYARHGRQFQAAWLQQYFFSQSWYTPDENFKDEELSGSDKQNVLTIVAYENKIHDDLSRKVITRNLLEGLFVEDASKMRQEIYARRGKVFKEAWFQKYFESFAWYKANPDFTDAQLSVVEKRNIATIAAYEKKATSVANAIEG
jgi:hypothetical protein